MPTASSTTRSTRPNASNRRRSCRPAATRRRNRSTTTTSRRWSTGCRRPAGSGAAPTGWGGRFRGAAGAGATGDGILFPPLRPGGDSDRDGAGAGGPSSLGPSSIGAGQLTPEPELSSAAKRSEGPPAPTQAPTRRPRALRTLAWLSVLVGLLSLLPPATSIRFSLGAVGFIAGGGRSAGLIASVAVGLGLIAVARGLSRGKRRAWGVATFLFAAAAVVHLIHGPDPITVVLSVAMLVALIWFRADFRAQGDPGSIQQALFFVPVYLIGVYLFTWITLFAERDHVSPALSFWGIFETAYKGMVGLDGPYAYGRQVFADFFEISLVVLGVAGLLIFLYLLLRTFVQADPPTPDRRRRAEEIVRQWGDDTLDYFALRRDKNYFFSADGESLIAYLYVRGTAMVAADPIGPPGSEARTLDEFLAFCAERGWRVAFFAVRESDAELYRERGMHTIYLGDEAILHCDRFSLDGTGMKAVRSAVKHVEKDHEFELIAETEAGSELIAELNEISEEWREGAPERGFTMELGEDVEGSESDFVLGNAARVRAARGVKPLSLNFGAWGRLLDSAEDAGFSGRLQRLMAKGLNPFFQIQSLRDFNQKFDPEWVPRSVVIDDVSDLPRVAMLYASVEGFLEAPVLSRILEPPIRPRVEAAKLPAGVA